MSRQYDLVVIGSGSAASGVATRVRQAERSVGPGAEDTINLFALAIRENLSVGALREALFAYPTAASDIGYML